MSVVNYGQGSNGARYSITVSCEDDDSNHEEESLPGFVESSESLSISYVGTSVITPKLRDLSVSNEIAKYCCKSPKVALKSLISIKKSKKHSRSAVFSEKSGLSPPVENHKPRKNSCHFVCCIL